MHHSDDIRVDLVVPIKGLTDGKSRLRGSIGSVDPAQHAELTLALALDTVTVAMTAPVVRRLLVITSDPTVSDALRTLGVELLPESQPHGLNPALQQGFRALRAQEPQSVIGALQSDLPALRAMDLTLAVTEAAGRRAFCADRHGIGTTLLLSSAGGPLQPAFGPGSAAAHARSNALAIAAEVLTLRCDVDTMEDLATAATLGLGPRTSALFGAGELRRSR